MEKTGFAKLQRFCALAKDDRFDYAWMDTCCIDKTSSAELSEAINSMYRWYQMSAVCYAYLEDVHNGDDPTKEESKFRQSRWFTRGWTLQELIAPPCIYFCSANWEILGTKLEGGRTHGDLNRRKRLPILLVPDLRKLLSTITGINLGILENRMMLQGCSAATRMSWVAFRQTTRPEDIAYCLMGIFDVNMPLLYGEGENKAFNRLQEEILRVTNDDTFLMHKCPESDCYHIYHPPLASSPKGFQGLGAVEMGEKGPLFHGRNIPSQMTPNGLRVQLPICPCEVGIHGLPQRDRAYIAILDCSIPGSYLDRGVIVLEKLRSGAFARHPNSEMARLEFEKQEVVLRIKGLTIYKGMKTTSLKKIRLWISTELFLATSIEIKNMRLETIHISTYTTDDLFRELFKKHHISLTFHEIEQPPGCNVVLHENIPTKSGNRFFLGKQVKLCFFIDETNGDAFIVILGAHKIVHGRGRGQSVPYCKISMKEPDQKLQDILLQECREMMYPDEDPD